MLNTISWLNLKDYVEELTKNGVQVTKAHVGSWLKHAVYAETMITQMVFQQLGYEHCLMRHSKKPEIDLFIAQVNASMGTWARENKRLSLSSSSYFDELLANLSQTLNSLVYEKACRSTGE